MSEKLAPPQQQIEPEGWKPANNPLEEYADEVAITEFWPLYQNDLFLLEQLATTDEQTLQMAYEFEEKWKVPLEEQQQVEADIQHYEPMTFD